MLTSWESKLVERIHPEISPLWAVEDLDGLFRSDKVSRLLTERGASIVLFDDPLMFRYFYEVEMRHRLESGEPCCYVLVLAGHPEGFRRLPADIYQACRRIEVALGDVFPKLTRSVLRELEPVVISKLWEKRDQIPPHILSERETADLVLRLGYRIEPSLIENFTDIIRHLIELHFNGQRLSESVSLRFDQICREIPGRPDNIHELICEPARFWEFMQKEWATWLEGEDTIKDIPHLRVPFSDNRIRIFVDNLFTEGLLSPVVLLGNQRKLPAVWCRVGVAGDSAPSSVEELIQQREDLAQTQPEAESSYQDWLRFAGRYSAHVAEWFSADRPEDKNSGFWDDFWTPLDQRFQQWLRRNLEGLHNLPPTRPVVIHHIPKFLARKVGEGDRVMLLVLDGLSLSQWKVLKPMLDTADDNILADEGGCFTLPPSLTNVCRQAIYSGELPLYFEKSIGRTDRDDRRWKTWWDGALAKPVKSHHVMVPGHPSDVTKILDAFAGEPQALGVTVKMPDDMMHGATMGWRGLHEQLRVWLGQGFLKSVVSAALAAGYKVFLTSDHGNLEAIGTGSPSEGVLAERRGERARIYTDPTIRKNSVASLKGKAFPWDTKILPQNYLPLIHAGRGAFATEGQLLVCHGGASLDEMVVPFIEFSFAH